MWDLYLKFYTVFLTINIAGLAVAIEFVEKISEWRFFYVAFLFQNIISAFTALSMSRYSKRACKEIEALGTTMIHSIETGNSYLLGKSYTSPVPKNLAVWSGIANALSHVAFIAIWVWFIWDKSQSQ